MKADRKRTVFVAVAAVALIVVIAVPAPERGGAPVVVPAAAAFPPRPAAPAAAGQAPEEQLSAQRERAAALEWGGDPFFHGVVASDAAAAAPAALPERARALAFPFPRLSGITLYDGARMALIDRQIVSEGDRLVSGHRVGAIADATVTLYRDGEPLVLRLGEQP